MTEYHRDRDMGDENDSTERKAARRRVRRNELDGQNASREGLDPIVAEQLELSLRVLSEASTLPPDMVDHHRRILRYWGVIE